MSATYYLDESGNTGDAVRVGEKLNFGDQPLFTLACIGISDLPALENELTRLKAFHKVQSAELKSSSLRKKPQFVEELIAYLQKQGSPLFVEVVDKKFFICAHIVSTLFLPAVNDIDFTQEAHFLRNAIAEYLSAHMPEAILTSIVVACDQPSKESIAYMLDSLAEWLGSIGSSHPVAAGALRFLEETRSDFEQLNPNEDFAKFLPIPDKGKRDQTYWMLPNLSSFTNIYARINYYRRGALSGVKLIHDEQTHFDAILIEAKKNAEQLSASEVALEVPHADYRFREKAALSFEVSATNVGLQVADCLAGFVMRYVLDTLKKGGSSDRASIVTFQYLLAAAGADRGTGVNFVLPSGDIQRLGISFA